MKRKLMSLFLCLVMGAGSAAMLASCAENPDTTTPGGANTNPGESAFMEKIPEGLNFPQLGFSEEDCILSVSYTEGTAGEFTRRSLKADELDESDVDLAIMARDQRMKEQLGLELDIVSTGDGIDTMEGAISTTLAAGTGDWDILAAYQYFGINLAAKGYLQNLADLASLDADYIDLNAPYWGQAFNENMSYKGAYYWITGDLALRYIGGMYCTFVNATLYNDMLSADYGSIYTIAKEGRWTIDLLTEMASKCYQDSGATPGEPDDQDTFGFGWEACDMIDGIAIGCGAQFTYKDPATGDISITVNNQRNYDISSKLKALANTSDFAFNFGNADNTIIMPAFASGTVAFTINKVYQAEAYLSEMEDDYYIIPAPKFDETQTNYITGLHDGCTIFGITYDSNKVQQAAAALEFLCAYSSKDVTPLYFEGALKGRYTRDAEAAAMIDLIHESVTTDFGVAWGDSLENIPHIFRDCGTVNNQSLKRKLSPWKTALATLTTELEKYVHGGAEA